MAEPTSFDEENGVLDPPAGMTLKECGCLSVYRGPDQNGNPLVYSCWKPTAEELDEIIRTGRIWIGILGFTMPPIIVTGYSPFPKPQ